MNDDSTFEPPAQPADSSEGSQDSLQMAGLGEAVAAEGLAAKVARAKVAQALFGINAAVEVGRYQVLAKVGKGGGGEVWSAFDPELNRRVALKVIATSDAAIHQRVRVEGRSLARLAHPNVVPVYDVVDHDDFVVLVMELVQGTSLRQWAASSRSFEEVLRAYVQVAEGLVAIHAAGLVHRDIKPDNIVIGEDGRVRMIDFGLAMERQAEQGKTRTSGGDGTPRYSAPEQLAGEPVGEAADIYAFCISMRESLTSTHREVPTWLIKLLDKGSQYDPADRVASAHDLLQVLRRGSQRGRRFRLAGALAAAVVVSGISTYFVAAQTSQRIDRCNDGSNAIALTWTKAQADHAQTHLRNLNTPYARTVAGSLVEKLDAYAASWAQAYNQSCKSRESADDSDFALVGLSARCLAQSRVALHTVASLLEQATNDTLPDIIGAVAALPVVEQCNDDVALLADGMPLASRDLPGVDALAEKLAQLRVLLDAVSPQALELGDKVLVEARELGDDGWLAQTLLLHGRAHLGDATGDRGAASFDEALKLALRHGNSKLAAEAFARRMWANVTTGIAPEVASGGVDLIESLLAPVGEASFERALLANNQVAVAQAAGQTKQALLLLQTAANLADRVRGQGELELLTVYENQLVLARDDTTVAKAFAQASRKIIGLLGQEHPRALILPITQAMLTRDAAIARKILSSACADLQLRHPHRAANLADCWYERAMLALAVGDERIARQSLEASAKAADAAELEGPALLARAELLSLDGRGDEGIALLTPALVAVADDAPWYERASYGELMVVQSALFASIGDAQASHEAARHAVEILEPVVRAQPMAWLARRLERARGLLASRENNEQQ